MIPHGSRALPILAVFLILLLAAEWLLPAPAAPSWAQRPAIPSAVADISTDADINQWANTILARPILSQTRRPALQTSTVVSEVLPRLSAIIVIGGTRHAIFAATGQKPQLVAEGDEIGLYRIETVAPDKVELLGPDGRLTLKPQFSTASPAAQTAAQ